MLWWWHLPSLPAGFCFFFWTGILPGGRGSGTWEDAGRPVPAIVQEPPPLDPAAPPPPTPQPPPIQPELPIQPPLTPPPIPPPAPPPLPKPIAPNKPAGPLGPATALPQEEALAALEDLTQGPQRRPERFLSDSWEAPDAADRVAYRQGLDSDGITIEGADPNDALDAIAADFSMSPTQIRDTLLAGIDMEGLGYSDVRTAIERTTTGYTITIIAEHDGGSLNLVRKFTRSAEGKLTTAKHEYFQMPASAQGSGVGKLFLRNQLALYDQLGIERITLYANIDVGGYAWARYGFKAASPEWWKALKPQLLENFNGIKDSLPESVAKTVRGLLRSADPKTIRQVAALQYQYVSASGAAQTLGKKLLLGTDWFGALDLTDPDDYAILLSYLH